MLLLNGFIACLTILTLALMNRSKTHPCTPAPIYPSLAYPKTMKLFFNKPLGILGPKSRTERLLAELRQIGTQPTKDQMHRLYAPIGLDIGADTPEEIALSIIAGIQAVITGRLGNQLRERKGSIHEQVSKRGLQSNPSAKRYVGV